MTFAEDEPIPVWVFWIVFSSPFVRPAAEAAFKAGVSHPILGRNRLKDICNFYRI
jgi:hypothetical protein